MRKVIRFIVAQLIQFAATRPNDQGMVFMLKMHNRFEQILMSTIKVKESQSGGIHPKHWVTDFHQFFLDHIQPTDRVLEIGCSNGHISAHVAEKAHHVTAVDIRPAVIEKAKQQFARDNLEFIAKDFFEFNEPHQFDVVIMSNVLEHIESRIDFLKKAAAIGKTVLIRVPGCDRDWLVPYKQHFGVECRLHPDHFLEYTEAILRKEVEEAGLVADKYFCKWGNHCAVVRQP